MADDLEAGSTVSSPRFAEAGRGGRSPRNRLALLTAVKDDRTLSAPASMRFSNDSVAGYGTPAAIGMPEYCK
jgi:hypothetical protein